MSALDALVTILHDARDRLLVAISKLETGDTEGAVEEIENAADTLRGIKPKRDHRSNGASV